MNGPTRCEVVQGTTPPTRSLNPSAVIIRPAEVYQHLHTASRLPTTKKKPLRVRDKVRSASVLLHGDARCREQGGVTAGHHANCRLCGTPLQPTTPCGNLSSCPSQGRQSCVQLLHHCRPFPQPLIPLVTIRTVSRSTREVPRTWLGLGTVFLQGLSGVWCCCL